MSFPHKKISPYQVDTQYWRLQINVEQATIEETDLFFALDDYSTYLIDYIRQNAAFIYSSSLLTKHEKRKQNILDTVLNDGKIITFIIDKRYRIHESAYTGIASGDGRKVLDWMEFLTVSKHYRIPPHVLITEYTYEQLGRLLDRVTFQAYESSDKLKGMNDKMFRANNKGWLSTEDEDLLALIKSQR